MTYYFVHVNFTAAIDVMKLIVNIPPFGNDTIPVFIDLQDDNDTEPMDFYELTIFNVSDPNVVVGVVNTSFIIVNDDDIAATDSKT